MPLDLRAATEALGLLAHIEHRQRQAVGEPGRERDARGLAARHRVELLEADIALHGRDPEIDQGLPHARERDQPPAVGVDRARPTRGEDEGPVAHEAHRLDFEQHLGRQLGHHLAVGEPCGGHRAHPFL